MNKDLPDDFGPVEPGLDQLISVLTAGATPDELAGEPAALDMFRASRARAAVAPRPRRRRRRAAQLVGVAALALAGGLAAGAYAVALPPPVQHVAYRVLGFAGVPDAHRPAPRPSRPQAAVPPTGRRTSPAPGTPSRSASAPSSAGASSPAPSPSLVPRPSGPGSGPLVPAQLSLTVAQHRIAAGGSDTLTGLLTDQQDRAVPGRQLTLLERAAGQSAWRAAGHAATDAHGRAVLVIQNLAANASFRFTGPDTQSQTARVIVVPPVSVTVAGGPRPQTDTLTVSSSFAVPGDAVVLQIQIGGQWRTLRLHHLSQTDQTVFVVKIRQIPRAYRAALLRTASHGRSKSSAAVLK
jgi:hypothetical protein